MRGEKIYEYDLDVTGMTDYGVSLDAILSGKVWVNTRQVWGVGTVNFAVGKIHIDAYMQ